MTLIDPGLNNGMCFGHTSYKTGEGRFISKSKNRLELNVNPELKPKERKSLSSIDSTKRNQYQVCLYCEGYMLIMGTISYNHANENLSLSTQIRANKGKKLFRIGDKPEKNPFGIVRQNVRLLAENNCVIQQFISYNVLKNEINFSSNITANNGKKLIRFEDSDIKATTKHRTLVKNELLGER